VNGGQGLEGGLRDIFVLQTQAAQPAQKQQIDIVGIFAQSVQTNIRGLAKAVPLEEEVGSLLIVVRRHLHPRQAGWRCMAVGWCLHLGPQRMYRSEIAIIALC
jgi:hypothetical protein